MKMNSFYSILLGLSSFTGFTASAQSAVDGSTMELLKTLTEDMSPAELKQIFGYGGPSGEHYPDKEVFCGLHTVKIFITNPSACDNRLIAIGVKNTPGASILLGLDNLTHKQLVDVFSYTAEELELLKKHANNEIEGEELPSGIHNPKNICPF